MHACDCSLIYRASLLNTHQLWDILIDQKTIQIPAINLWTFILCTTIYGQQYHTATILIFELSFEHTKTLFKYQIEVFIQ